MEIFNIEQVRKIIGKALKILCYKRMLSSLTIVTFSWGQKRCDYLGKFDYSRCDYYAWGQYFKKFEIKTLGDFQLKEQLQLVMQKIQKIPQRKISKPACQKLSRIFEQIETPSL